MHRSFPKSIVCGLTALGVLIFGLPTDAGASWNAGSFYKFGIGSRPFGMGDAFVAVADDATAIFWNPAALVRVPAGQFFVSHADRFGLELQEQSAGATFIVRRRYHVGVGLIRAGLDGIKQSTRRDGNDRPIIDGTFGNSQISMVASTGLSIHEHLSVGLAAKFYAEELSDKSAQAWGIDLAWVFHPRDNLTVGFNGQNLNRPRMKWNTGTGHFDRIPANLKFGGAAHLLTSQLTIAVDINAPDFERVLLNSGAEYNIGHNFAIRAGFSGDQPGAGTSFKWNHFRLDYGYRPHDLGDTHRVTLFATL